MIDTDLIPAVCKSTVHPHRIAWEGGMAYGVCDVRAQYWAVKKPVEVTGWPPIATVEDANKIMTVCLKAGATIALYSLAFVSLTLGVWLITGMLK